LISNSGLSARTAENNKLLTRSSLNDRFVLLKIIKEFIRAEMALHQSTDTSGKEFFAFF
jgi:hypothetical protein